MRYSRICIIPLAFSIIAAGLAGCSEKSQTVEWYMQHKGEREVKVNWCRNDAARAVEPDCLNAEKAVERVMLESKKRAIDTFTFKPDPKFFPEAAKAAAEKEAKEKKAK